MTLRELQDEVGAWSRRNFGDQPSVNPLLGAVEEMGELAHAHLKREQGIRGTADEHHAKARDAVADVIVFLADYCSRMGYDLEASVEEAWSQVRQRDWTADPTRGRGSAA